MQRWVEEQEKQHKADSGVNSIWVTAPKAVSTNSGSGQFDVQLG